MVTRYRARGAIREAGKALGLPEDVTKALAGLVWGWSTEGAGEKQAAELNLNLKDRRLRLAMDLANQLMNTPRHLSQHPGGFVLTHDRLDDLVPIEPAAMADRQDDPMEGFFRANPGGTGVDDEDDFFEAVRNEKMGLGIASLSETWDNELMWAHHAAGFRGICVAYPTARLLRGLDAHHALARVAYSERPHYLGLKDMRNRDDRARAVLSAKSLKWAYEREWRLFSPQPGHAHHGSNGAATVYLGMRMTDADRRAISRRLAGTGIGVRRTLVDGYSLRCLKARHPDLTPDSLESER